MVRRSQKCPITSERTDSLYCCIARPSKNRRNQHVPNNLMKRRKNNGTHTEQSRCQKTGETVEKRVATENCMRIWCDNGRWDFCIKKTDTSRNVQAIGSEVGIMYVVWQPNWSSCRKTRTTSPTRWCSTVIIVGQIAENKHVWNHKERTLVKTTANAWILIPTSMCMNTNSKTTKHRRYAQANTDTHKKKRSHAHSHHRTRTEWSPSTSSKKLKERRCYIELRRRTADRKTVPQTRTRRNRGKNTLPETKEKTTSHKTARIRMQWAKSMSDYESNHAHTQLNTRTPSSTTNRESMCSLYVAHTRPQQYIVTVFRFPKRACESLLHQIQPKRVSIIQDAVTHERWSRPPF